MDRSEATHIQALASVLKPNLIDKCLPLLVNDLRAETIFDPWRRSLEGREELGVRSHGVKDRAVESSSSLVSCLAEMTTPV